MAVGAFQSCGRYDGPLCEKPCPKGNCRQECDGVECLPHGTREPLRGLVRHGRQQGRPAGEMSERCPWRHASAAGGFAHAQPLKPLGFQDLDRCPDERLPQ